MNFLFILTFVAIFLCLCGQIEDNKKICKGCQETLVGFLYYIRFEYN